MVGAVEERQTLQPPLLQINRHKHLANFTNYTSTSSPGRSMRESLLRGAGRPQAPTPGIMGRWKVFHKAAALLAWLRRDTRTQHSQSAWNVAPASSSALSFS
ncbi:hypothetical protein E2C01_021166 [Portunus trituberculatus]|uniref:Uncharacterized protein n=1 Tax=Portunus trituberculatus TaxID=210409 RepID=A0A5B7E3X7_PORTR|nr:hypothetical protein [Portunus trituberculatus]